MSNEDRVKEFWAFYTAHWAMPNLGKTAMQEWVDWIIANTEQDRLMKTMEYLVRVKDEDYPPMLALIKRSYKMFDLRGYTMYDEQPLPDCSNCANSGMVYVVCGRNSSAAEWYLISREALTPYTETEVREHPCHCRFGVPLNDEIYPCKNMDEQLDRSRKLATGWGACFQHRANAEVFAKRQRQGKGKV